MARTEFDIYQSPSGFVAVTNPVRRRILAALAAGDLQLPQLVKLTGRAKPTLSSVHLRDLLSVELIQEYPDPSDSRKKFYRLTGRPIGSSNVPVDQLREAVRTYAATPSVGARVGLAGAVRALAAAPPRAAAAIVRAQAVQLGKEIAPTIPATSARMAIQAVAGLLEREGVAATLRLDLERLQMELEPHGGVAAGEPSHRLRTILEGIVEGVLDGLGLGPARVAGSNGLGRRRLRLALVQA